MPHPSVTALVAPDKPAIIMGGSGDSLSYALLDRLSNQGAQLFRALGLRSGDHICMMMENHRLFMPIVWAAQRAGLIFTPVSCYLTKQEAVYILNNCGARVFIGSLQVADLCEEVLCEPCRVNHYFMVGGTRPGFASWEDALAQQNDAPIRDQGNGMPMVYSSGTTGRPKGVFVPPLSDDVNTPPLLAHFQGALGFDLETVYLSPAPLHHAGPLHYAMMAIYQGCTIVVMEKFDAEQALKYIEHYRITHSQWVPIMFIRMLKLPRVLRESYDLSSLKVAIHAAAPCPEPVKEQMLEWWGGILVEYYAASEGIGVTMIDSEEWLDHRGSVGRPVMGQVHIVDTDGGDLGTHEVGQVFFSGDHVTFSYYNEPDKTAQAYDDQGRATTGDVGYLDDEGYLYLTDRIQHTIISGGINIYPQEIENVLVMHDKVADAAVFGIPHEEFGEEVKAVVQPVAWRHANAQTATDILHWLRSHIAGPKMPRSLDFHPHLPRMDNGKLYKQELVEDYRARDRARSQWPGPEN
ncbi:MAG: acyl-CoA synthetase [Pseudomonadota bacterium]